MMQALTKGIMFVVLLLIGTATFAQEPENLTKELTIATVTRAPFSMVEDSKDVGFSIALWHRLADDINLTYKWVRYDTFGEMINAVENGEADAAIANISITEEREKRLDFTQPIFETGLQIMLRGGENGSYALLQSIFSPKLFIAIGVFFLITLAIGMLMWTFEKSKQDMFGKTAKEAAFPAFWWALNLIISSAHEEEMPRSNFGRLFGTIMLICSLFLVSFFTANITAALTLNAISEDVNNISDLDGRRVGTTEGSTTSTYLNLRGIQHTEYNTLDALLFAFEEDEIEAVVFDGPILAYYMQTKKPDDTRLIERFFKREGYGIAVPTGSVLREPLDRALLRVRESGTYEELKTEWFGGAYISD